MFTIYFNKNMVIFNLNILQNIIELSNMLKVL